MNQGINRIGVFLKGLFCLFFSFVRLGGGLCMRLGIFA